MTDLFDKYGHPIKVLINPDCPSDLFDKSGRPHIVVENADGIDLSTGEFLAALLKGGNLLHIPTISGWGESVVGSGSSVLGVSSIMVSSGPTANSKATLAALLYGFNVGGAWYLKFNWNKRVYIVFNLVWQYDISTGIGRFQLKNTGAEGALSYRGIGIRMDNRALKGESYGTSLGVVDLAINLTQNYIHRIAIIHYPGSKIEWYVNGVLKGTQSTLANIPSGVATGGYLVHSTLNGATASDARTHILHPKIWQEA